MKLTAHIILVACCLLGLAFAVALRGGEGQARTSLAANGESGCWRVVSASTGSQAGELYNLAVAPDGDLWALGGATNGSAPYPYILHMDGAQWTSMPGPSFTQTVSQTYGLDVLKVFSQNDIWAGGGIYYWSGNPVSSSTSGLVVHWDGESMELLKSTLGTYVASYDPIAMRVWRVPVVETAAVPALTGIVGNFQLGATLWDRQQSEILVGQPNDFFLRNAFAVLAELRAAFAVTRPLAFEKMTFIANV